MQTLCEITYDSRISLARWESLHLVSVNNRSPVCDITTFGDFPNLMLPIEPDSGAWHGGDISVIFDTDNDIQHTDDRMFEDERFGRYWRGAWATFARDPERGLVK